jgi:hypothetical protein
MQDEKSAASLKTTSGSCNLILIGDWTDFSHIKWGFRNRRSTRTGIFRTSPKEKGYNLSFDQAFLHVQSSRVLNPTRHVDEIKKSYLLDVAPKNVGCVWLCTLQKANIGV